MKRYIRPTIVTSFVIVLILSLPFLLPKRVFNEYSDSELRATALSRNMLPTPKTYEELLKVVDNPQNPLSREKTELGKRLYFDTRLSRDKSINCATCHLLGEGGDDNRPTAIGYKGRVNPFHLNSPTVLNSALAKSVFWDGRAKDVEEQAGGPIQAPFEMNMTPDEVVKRVKTDSSYQEDFKKIYGGITFENITKAIGAYERTLLTYGTYDKFLDGDDSAMSEKAKRGFALFIDLGCKGCHTGMAVGGESIQKFPVRKCSSIYDIKCLLKTKPYPFENIGGYLGRGDNQYFRVPILRNITKTAPYFHNGAVKELKDVIKLMAKHQVGYELNEKQIDEIYEFLKSLEGELVDY